MIDLEKEALKYDLLSLKKLQEKRKENVVLFENSIKNERAALQQEESAQSNLENKLNNHDSGLSKLSDADREWILTDLPKLKSTKEKRNNTIMLLKAAIIEEYNIMDHEDKMIFFLEKKHGNKI